MNRTIGWMAAGALALAGSAAEAAEPAHAGHAAPPAAATNHAAMDHGAMGHDAGAKAPSTAQMVDAEVRRIDAAGKKLTLKHGPLTNLDMGAMTMAFAVKDPAWLQTLKVGDKVRVAVDRVDGTLTVVALEPAK